MKQKFLVVDDYGTGGIWRYILARSKEEVKSKYPGFEIVDEEPSWFDDETRKSLQCHDIDDEPTGFLKTMLKKE